MFGFLLVVCALPALISAQLSPCPNGASMPIDLRVEGCPNPPCGIEEGDQLTFEIDFVAPRALTKLTTFNKIFTVGGVEIPIEAPADHLNACDGVVGGCPIASGAKATYKLAVDVDDEALGEAPENIIIEFGIEDPAGPIVCMRIDTTHADMFRIRH